MDHPPEHPRPRTLAVVGLGTMGCGIAAAALASGFSVVARDVDADATSAGIDAITLRWQRLVGAADTRPVALGPFDDAASLSGEVDLVIEAVSESYEAKRPLLGALASAFPGVIATNTSALSVDELARDLHDPTRFLGVHFFNPAESIPGVEIVRGTATSAEAVGLAEAVLQKMSKEASVVLDSPGFIANRIQFALFSECARCLEEGLASAEEIDRIVRTTFGFRLGAYGPFRVADMAGLDVYLSILGTLSEQFGDRFAPTRLLIDAVADGRHGVKSGAGVFDYGEGEVEEMVGQRDGAYARLLAAISAEDPG